MADVIAIFPEKPNDGTDYFTSVEIQNLAGVTFRQVDYWTRTGLLTPIGPEFAHGSGYHRRYAPDQLARAKAISALLRAGLALPAIRKHIDTVMTVGALTYGPVTITYTPEEDPA